MYNHPLFYQLDYPECPAYAFRAIGTYPVFFVKSTWNTCYPGNYLMMTIINFRGDIKVYIDDGDDGYVEKHFSSLKEALISMQEISLLEPFSLDDLEAFGYKT